jgi:hypothetical protein
MPDLLKIDNNEISKNNNDQPQVNIVLECIMAMVNDPVLNENKRLGKTEQSEKRITDILAQFGMKPLLKRFFKGS